MKYIELSKGYKAIVDDSDFEMLSGFAWHVVLTRNPGRIYASHSQWYPEIKKLKQISMHRMILGMSTPNTPIDHADGNGLNNQRANLRWATRTQNSANRRKQKNNTSGYPGVSFNKRSKKWAAYIQKDGKMIGLGLFKTIEKAVKCRRAKSKELFGDYAPL